MLNRLICWLPFLTNDVVSQGLSIGEFVPEMEGDGEQHFIMSLKKVLSKSRRTTDGAEKYEFTPNLIKFKLGFRGMYFQINLQDNQFSEGILRDFNLSTLDFYSDKLLNRDIEYSWHILQIY